MLHDLSHPRYPHYTVMLQDTSLRHPSYLHWDTSGTPTTQLCYTIKATPGTTTTLLYYKISAIQSTYNTMAWQDLRHPRQPRPTTSYIKDFSHHRYPTTQLCYRMSATPGIPTTLLRYKISDISKYLQKYPSMIRISDNPGTPAPLPSYFNDLNHPRHSHTTPLCYRISANESTPTYASVWTEYYVIVFVTSCLILTRRIT